MEKYNKLGELLKSRRVGIGLTLRQVEEATGISNAYLSQLENDKIKKPSANVLYKLSSLYKIQLENLLIACGLVQQDGKHEPSTTIGPFKITNEEEDQLLEYLEFIRHKKHC